MSAIGTPKHGGAYPVRLLPDLCGTVENPGEGRLLMEYKLRPLDLPIYYRLREGDVLRVKQTELIPVWLDLLVRVKAVHQRVGWNGEWTYRYCPECVKRWDAMRYREWPRSFGGWQNRWPNAGERS